MDKVPMVDGSEIEVIPVGTRVHSRRHKDLFGVVETHEYREAGVLSRMPYKVKWDDPVLARHLLGWWFIYAGPQDLEVVKS